ncbi:MAG: hypothetical protein BZY88_15445 [SAR202 cluster bacterium Io17-Chloro-G9]|nr:MAG: hypothetical protein BZY88_15445 [SAR202 cluster bacterium Io17-Chloro-G9]
MARRIDTGATDVKPPRDQQLRLAQDAAVLRAVLDREVKDTVPVEEVRRPLLVALCGLPGTGKSHFARELVKRVPMLVLETDRLRKILVPKPKYRPGEHRRVFRVCYSLIEEYIAKGHRVLFDATNLTEDFRQPLYQIAERTEAQLVLVGFTAPSLVVKERLAARQSGQDISGFSDATWVIHSRMRPFEEPILRDHLMVDSSQDITGSLDRVVDMISSGHDPNARSQIMSSK